MFLFVLRIIFINLFYLCAFIHYFQMRLLYHPVLLRATVCKIQ